MLSWLSRIDSPQTTEHFAAITPGQSDIRDPPGQFIKIKFVSAAGTKTSIREIDSFFGKAREGREEVLPQL
jgi:hypothetical protein